MRELWFVIAVSALADAYGFASAGQHLAAIVNFVLAVLCLWVALTSKPSRILFVNRQGVFEGALAMAKAVESKAYVLVFSVGDGSELLLFFDPRALRQNKTEQGG